MDSLDKDIEKIKLSRMKPEERFLFDIVKDLKKYVKIKNYKYSYEHSDYVIFNDENHKYINMFFYKINDNIYFIHNNLKNIIFCSNNQIWSTLQLKYNLCSSDIRKLITKMVCETLNIKDANPSVAIF
jgi:hypothetical protein